MASAQKAWELENAVQLVEPARDALYNYDPDVDKAFTKTAPWKQDPHFLTTCRISAVALLKMVMHARSGGSLEIMGLMQGYSTAAGEVIVTDAFRLPVEGTETRVNAQDDANEYMVSFLERARNAGQLENAVGWYHSHPGYGCWLSGTDVMTQSNQQLYDPFVAVVIDPERTISAGKVEIGAFRTYPEGYNKAETGDAAAGATDSVDADGFQTIPVDKIEDFGAHSARYYSLEVSHFKSSLDTKLLEALWNKYWVDTLASSPLLTNREYGTKQMADLALKIRMADTAAGGGSAARRALGPTGGQAQGRERTSGKAREQQLDKIVKAGNKIAAEELSGLAATDIKEKLFSGTGAHAALGSGGAVGAAPQAADAKTSTAPSGSAVH